MIFNLFFSDSDKSRYLVIFMCCTMFAACDKGIMIMLLKGIEFLHLINLILLP